MRVIFMGILHRAVAGSDPNFSANQTGRVTLPPHQHLQPLDDILRLEHYFLD
jgi:hypothetical protein